MDIRACQQVHGKLGHGSTGMVLETGELQVGSGCFDPSEHALRLQLLSKLGRGGHCTVEAMKGFRGGLNEGIWYVRDPAQGGLKDLVLKLVTCRKLAAIFPTEAESFMRICREHPNIVNDRGVAFPLKVLACIGPAGKAWDLIVMQKVRGERLAEFIARKWYSTPRRVSELLEIMDKLGACLAKFHGRYGGCQHGDFQTANIFYDEGSGEFTFIDIGGMGTRTGETDAQHFAKNLQMLASTYPELARDGFRYFDQGYQRAKQLS
jgi:tRNA A-37 threonylcarbamoyl transferase component Bud32